MAGITGPGLSEETVRAAWYRMVAETLPAAAPGLGWPQRTQAEFERDLLEQVTESCCDPRAPCAMDMVLAIELADRALRGQVCMKALARRARERRGTA